MPNPSSDAFPTRRATREGRQAPRRGTKPGSRRRGRRELERAVRVSNSKAKRKNPASVLLTMSVVGGLLAVFGLPAYARGPVAAADAPRLHMQSLVISDSAAELSVARDSYRATTPEQLAQMSRDAARSANTAAYLASGAQELGDDYPWFHELTQAQGGGLSPLNYYYRECVDFVAWRLNRDAGYYSAPYKWVWATLTPNGGDASQWRSSWEAHGWTVSATPVLGAVAWFPNNHVAYVKAVPGDGTVVIEEYNHNFSHVYGQRVLAVGAVAAFLYPPG